MATEIIKYNLKTILLIIVLIIFIASPMKLKITHILFCVFICLSSALYSQITDGFTDGDFSYAPSWSGNDTDFIVNSSRQLQLNSSGTSASYLSLSNTQPLNDCEWNFWIKLNFSPSSGNFARVFLVSDSSSLSGNVNGYYLQFGETGTGDQVELFRKSGSSSVSVCRGTTNIANAFAIRVKVTRDNTGLWKLFIDPSGGTNYALEASGTDNTFSYTSYFGVYCKYTSTNSSGFYFDDFYIYSPPDVLPATVDSAIVISQNQLAVYFNEALEPASAQIPSNFLINNGIGFAQAAIPDSADHTLVHLSFQNYFSNGQTYLLTVTGVEDLSGNTTINTTSPFFVFLPQANDVAINEIMADINPVPNSLPPYEYIELFNRTNFSVKLNGWTLSDATSTKVIPSAVILPDSFLVLTSMAGDSAFLGINVVGVPSFQTLNDAGDDMILRDAGGNIISVVYYDLSWYHDPIKQNGGWSIEQIDPGNPCGGKTNWKASADNSGGTPGRINSVFANIPDVIPPQSSHVAMISSNTLQVFFNEPMDSVTLLNLFGFLIDHEIGSPVAADPVEPDYTSVMLSLPSTIAAGIIYTITINGARDCAGNLIASGNAAQFGVAEPASSNDLVINEVMFDPKENGAEWVEIYNRSSKIIDLKEVFLCSLDESGTLKEINQVAPKGFIFLPQRYLVLSTDGNNIKEQYTTTNPNGFADMNSIPALSNDSDWIVLVNTSQTIIDKLHYHSDWHLPLLNDTKGISLERISYDTPAQDENNWHSASESVGGATPAYKNSQYTEGESGSEITISSEVFSPDNDGYNDVLSISYSFDEPGMVGSVNIYDSRGRLEKTLVRNELLGSSGTFFWDGITDEKLKARIGIYIVFFEAFDTKGNVKKYKKPCVVGGKL